MKKYIMAALIAVALTSSAFATDTKAVNTAVTSSFNSDFAKANEVKWTTTANYAKASFVINSERMEAFYDFDGDLIATSKAVTIDQLPARGQKAFTKGYGDYTVKEVIHLDGTAESGYFISAEKDDRTVILKVSDAGELSIFKRSCKS